MNFYIMFVLIDFVPGVILLAWLWVSPSVAKHVHPTREDNLLVCSSFTDASYMMVSKYIFNYYNTCILII